MIPNGHRLNIKERFIVTGICFTIQSGAEFDELQMSGAMGIAVIICQNMKKKAQHSLSECKMSAYSDQNPKILS